MVKQNAIITSFLTLFILGCGMVNADAASVNTDTPTPTESALIKSITAQLPLQKDIEHYVIVPNVAGKGLIPHGINNSVEREMWARLNAGRNAVDNALKQNPGTTKGYAYEYISEEFDGRVYEVVCNVIVW